MRNGLMFGAILGAINVGGVIVQWLTGGYNTTSQVNGGFTSVTFADTGVPAIVSCVNFLVALALPFIAGMLAARRTGRVGDGSLAGLVTGAAGALFGGVASVVVILTLVAPSLQPPEGSVFTPSQLQDILIGGAIFGLVGGLLLDSGLGAGLGALGGLVGRSSYEKANPPAYQPPFYPYAPGQPGAYYPGYSPAPYPGQQYPPSPYAPPPYAPPPYAGQQYPAPPYPGQAGDPTTPAQPQEPQPPQQG